jgi:hypothetical protein
MGDHAMKGRTRWIAGLSAVAVLLTTTVIAFGYTGQVAATVTVATPGTITCDVPFTVSATVVDATGAPVSDQSVAWAFTTTQSSSDRIGLTPTVTNAKGVATTTVILAAVNGNRQLRATAGDIGASAVLTQVCGGLPNTSTLPAADLPIAALLIVTVAVAVGGGLTLRLVTHKGR